MAVLGGDDAGGGVIWAPQVLNDAKQHGLILSEKGKIYDTKIGQNLPHDEKEMPALTKKELSQFPEIEASEITPFYVARYLDLYSLSKRNFVSVIGEYGVIYDKPGFEVNFISEKCTNKIKNYFSLNVDYKKLLNEEFSLFRNLQVQSILIEGGISTFKYFLNSFFFLISKPIFLPGQIKV